jgi:hypothetical protein
LAKIQKNENSKNMAINEINYGQTIIHLRDNDNNQTLLYQGILKGDKFIIPKKKDQFKFGNDGFYVRTIETDYTMNPSNHLLNLNVTILLTRTPIR